MKTRLDRLELSGFKSFGKKTELVFSAPITAIVGPNGSGKSNIAEAFRWVLGEQSLKSLRGKRGEDLIFNGGGGGASRASRAEVTVVFDNRSHAWPWAYDEVIVSREVFRDGSNDYRLNASKVRLRDVVELLAAAALGASGHHIISQGEADRLLLSSPPERRGLVEEALGLRLYRWKILESDKKLAKTEENIKQAEALRKEIAPHLKFLSRQVEKIEKAQNLRRELKKLYQEFLPQAWRQLLEAEKDLSHGGGSVKIVDKLEVELADWQKKLRQAGGAPELEKNIKSQINDLERLRREQSELERELGRLEGRREAQTGAAVGETVVKKSELEKFGAELIRLLDVGTAAAEIKKYWHSWWRKVMGGESRPAPDQNLEQQYQKISADLLESKKIEQKLAAALTLAQTQKEESAAEAGRAEKKILELTNQIQLARAEESNQAVRQSALARDKEEIKREAEEGAVLVDQEILDYAKRAESRKALAEMEWQNLAPAKRKEIEKIKIRLEDMGVEGGEVLKEFDSVKTRDEFLATELADLAKGAEACAEIKVELEEKLATEFNQGLVKINAALARFMGLLFGGGAAELVVTKPVKKKTEEDELDLESETEEEREEKEMEEKEGLDIKVSLPRKHIKGLAMLSGGERALVSIALLFALSQVNPPPFLILDETDAALDEANSRKYGDMIEELSRHSQLILITHNRETMSRAGILYGVTMGADGISRLLSLKFDEASGYAKQ